MMEHPYAKFLAKVEKPGRYVGGEFGAVDAPAEADLRIALAFPDSYEIGMSHIGISVLYEVVNKIPNISAERVFMPWPDLESNLKERDLPLVSLESARPLGDFDAVGFSLQYELNYTNLIAMLSMGRIPRRADDRGDGDPIVIVGGPAAAHCEPIAPFVDICFLGDGEEELPRLLLEIVEAKKLGQKRREIIQRLAASPNAFAPWLLKRSRDNLSGRMVVEGNDEPVARLSRVESLTGQAPGFGPVPTVQAVFDRYSVEIARGCAGGCRFCQAGFLYRPVRERTEPDVRDAVERAVTGLGFDGVSLAALSTADCSAIDRIVTTLGEIYTRRRVSLSVPSLRAYGLPSELVEVLGRMRATGVTLAPEAGTQRLRDVINKNVTEADLMDASARFFDWGFTKIKLYFMLGLPTETDEDLVEIVELASRLTDFGRKRLRGRRPNVTVSVSTFIPKPATPFEREEMVGFDEIQRRQEIIAKGAKQARLEARFHDPWLSVLEGVLSRGDIELASVLEEAVDKGARFDGWDDMFSREVWRELFEGIGLERLLARIPEDARVPWDHLDLGVSRAFLKRERRRAQKAKTTEPCGRFIIEKNANKEDAQVVCHSCGLDCEPESLPLKKPIIRQSEEEISSRPKSMRGPLKPRTPDDGQESEPARIRLFFAKWGRQAFLGHLDTMRHLLLSLRRAGFRLAYTKGFHPKPKLESAPPLPLGMAAMREPLDVFLIDPPPIEEILKRLKTSMPKDLAFVDAQKIAPGVKSLGRQITSAKYVARLNADPQTVKSGVERLLKASSLVVEREKKGKIKRQEIRPFLLDARFLDELPSNLPLLKNANMAYVSFVLDLPGSGGARPMEILQAILDGYKVDAQVVRTELTLG